MQLQFKWIETDHWNADNVLSDQFKQQFTNDFILFKIMMIADPKYANIQTHTQTNNYSDSDLSSFTMDLYEFEQYNIRLPFYFFFFLFLNRQSILDILNLETI